MDPFSNNFPALNPPFKHQKSTQHHSSQVRSVTIDKKKKKRPKLSNYEKNSIHSQSNAEFSSKANHFFDSISYHFEHNNQLTTAFFSWCNTKKGPSRS